jgi:lipid-binding SYLF domain-containing protein
MTWTARIVAALLLAIGLMGGCSTAPTSQEGKDELVRQARTALREWDRDVPGLEGFARRSYGYAVFPTVAKGGLGVGAAYGRGVVYEQGEHIGYADLSYLSLGLQVGGQAYQVLVAFDNEGALERFTQGRLDFSADASGVFLEAGYVINVTFIEEVTVFSRPIGGVMGEAAMGGQRFTFVFREDRGPGPRARPAARPQ